jgi:hypothetical protein
MVNWFNHNYGGMAHLDWNPGEVVLPFLGWRVSNSPKTGKESLDLREPIIGSPSHRGEKAIKILLRLDITDREGLCSNS